MPCRACYTDLNFQYLSVAYVITTIISFPVDVLFGYTIPVGVKESHRQMFRISVPRPRSSEEIAYEESAGQFSPGIVPEVIVSNGGSYKPLSLRAGKAIDCSTCEIS